MIDDNTAHFCNHPEDDLRSNNRSPPPSPDSSCASRHAAESAGVADEAAPLLPAARDESFVSEVTFSSNAACEGSWAAEDGEGIAFRIRDCVEVVGNHVLEGMDLLCL